MSDEALSPLLSLTEGWTRIYGVIWMVISAVVNFIILSFIFISTMYVRMIQLKEDISMIDVFARGIFLALSATMILFIVDITSGGFGTLIMIIVYPIAFVVSIIMSLLAPTIIYDRDTYISSYRIWTISFWSIFIVGMIVALSLGIFLSYIGTKFSTVLMGLLDDMADKISIQGDLNVV